MIPNKEVREVFVLQIQEWFKETIQKDAAPVKALSQAFLRGGSGSGSKAAESDSWKIDQYSGFKSQGRAKGKLLPWFIAGAFAKRAGVAGEVKPGGGRWL